MLRRFFFTLAMLTTAVLSNFATADESDAAKKVDTNPSGTWYWNQDFGAGEAELWLVMNAKRKNLTGTLMMDGLDQPAEITDGKYEDGKFSFKLNVPVDGNDISSSVAGQVDFESIELKDNVVVLKTNIPLAGGLDLTLTCVPKGNKMTGEMIFEGDEAEGTAEVMGSRVRTEKK